MKILAFILTLSLAATISFGATVELTIDHAVLPEQWGLSSELLESVELWDGGQWRQMTADPGNEPGWSWYYEQDVASSFCANPVVMRINGDSDKVLLLPTVYPTGWEKVSFALAMFNTQVIISDFDDITLFQDAITFRAVDLTENNGNYDTYALFLGGALVGGAAGIIGKRG